MQASLQRKHKRISLSPVNGGVAQLGEHLPCTQGVRSSILLISTGFQIFDLKSLQIFLQSLNDFDFADAKPKYLWTKKRGRRRELRRLRFN